MASGPQKFAADLDGNIALANVHAVDSDALLARGEYAVQTVVDQQGDLAGLAGLCDCLRGVAGQCDDLAGACHLGAHLDAGKAGVERLGHHIAHGAPERVFGVRVPDQAEISRLSRMLIVLPPASSDLCFHALELPVMVSVIRPNHRL